jgi:hypothetical protein
MLAEEQPDSTSRFGGYCKLGILHKAAQNTLPGREVPCKMYILAVFEEAGIPIQVKVFEVLEDHLAVHPKRPRRE